MDQNPTWRQTARDKLTDHAAAAVVAGVIAVLAIAGTAVWQLIVVPHNDEDIEILGDIPSKLRSVPACPRRCQVVARTTAYQLKLGSQRLPLRVSRTGKITAWSISLAALGRKQQGYFRRRLGRPQAGIAILRPGPRSRYKLIALGPVQMLSNYIRVIRRVRPKRSYSARVQRFPLKPGLAVEEGDVVALRVPTWAPALATGLRGESAWRTSQKESTCRTERLVDSTHTIIGSSIDYTCTYTTAHLSYTAERES